MNDLNPNINKSEVDNRYDLINRGLLDANEFYSTILNHLPDTVIKINAQMEIIWVNRIVIETIGDVIGQHCYTAYHDRTTPCDNCPCVRCLETGEVEKGILSQLESPQSKRLKHIETVGIPIKDEANKVIAAIVVGKDVTAKQESINALSELTQELDAERLQRVEEERRRTEFLYHVSAEIKYNVDLISEEINVLRKNATQEFPRNALDRLTEINEKSKRQLANVFELYSIEQKSINLINMPFEIREVVDEIYNRFKIPMMEKNIVLEHHLESRIPKKLIGDAYRLKNILFNIIDNSIRHTENGKIRIELSSMLRSQNKVSFKVTILDTGMGFTEEQMQQVNSILEDRQGLMFQRAAQMKGLSLLTAKKILEAMDGNLSIKSTFGRGTEVIMTFTMAYSSEIIEDLIEAKKQPVEVADKVENVKRKKILIAEDEVVGRVSMKLMLQNHYDVILVKNGKEAVESFKRDMPDIVLMDIMMPVMDGFEAFDEIEKINRLQIPIIACTAKVIESEKEYLMSYGFNDYLPKPVDLSGVNRVLMKYFKKSPV